MPAERQSLRNVHFALLTSDTEDGVAYKTPEKLIGAVAARITPTSNTAQTYSDDGVSDVVNALSQITVEIDLDRLPLEARAKLCGHTYSAGQMVLKDDDEAPYVALGFMSQVTAGEYRLHWLLKGKFSEINEELNTATDTPAWRTNTLVGTFVRRDYDRQWQRIADTGAESSTAKVETWFASVEPAAAAGAGD